MQEQGRAQAAARAGREMGTLSRLFPCQGRVIQSVFCRCLSLDCLPCLPGDRVRSVPAPSRRSPLPHPGRAGAGGGGLQAGFCATPALLLEIGKFNNQSKGEREEEKSGIRASLMAHARCCLHPKHTHISLDLESQPKQPQVQVSPSAPARPRPRRRQPRGRGTARAGGAARQVGSAPRSEPVPVGQRPPPRAAGSLCGHRPTAGAAAAARPRRRREVPWGAGGGGGGVAPCPLGGGAAAAAAPVNFQDFGRSPGRGRGNTCSRSAPRAGNRSPAAPHHPRVPARH